MVYCSEVWVPALSGGLGRDSLEDVWSCNHNISFSNHKTASYNDYRKFLSTVSCDEF